MLLSMNRIAVVFAAAIAFGVASFPKNAAAQYAPWGGGCCGGYTVHWWRDCSWCGGHSHSSGWMSVRWGSRSWGGGCCGEPVGPPVGYPGWGSGSPVGYPGWGGGGSVGYPGEW